MRKILLLPAIIFTALHVYAGENDPHASTTSTPVVGGLFPHFGLGSPNSTVPGNQRMIAKTYMVFKDGYFTTVDSITYQYSNGRGSAPNPDDINNDDHVVFDLSTTYSFNTASGLYENSRQRTQYFTDNKVSELIYKKWNDNTSAWKNAERYLYTYDNNGKMHSSVLQLWYGTLWTNNINSVLNYDQNNNIVQMNSSTYTIDFVYDQNNNLVRIEDRVWSQGAGWSNNERKTYTYTGTDVTAYVLEKWVNGIWTNNEKKEYIYNANAKITLTTTYKWGGNGWEKANQESYTYDLNDNMLEKIEKVWNVASGVYEFKSRQVRTYNAYDMPTAITGYTWDGGKWMHAENDIVIRYYYELYFPTSVSNTATINNMELYPVPATDRLNISLNNTGREDFALTLTDMAGRVVYSEQVHNTGAYQKAIQVSEIPAGNYLLRVAGKGINMTDKVVLAH